MTTIQSVRARLPRVREAAVNPVLARELTERWRSRRAVLTLTGFLTVLAGLEYLLYRAGRAFLRDSFGFLGGMDATASGPLLGRFLLESLLFFVLLLVLFVGPGYAAAQLSGERERRTLPLLQVTLLRPWQIVAGKLGASVAWISLLVVAALPLGAASFYLGGVALSELLRGIAYVVATGLSVSAMALGISSVTRRTASSVVLTYGLVLALTLGTGVVAIAQFAISEANVERRETPSALYLNPFFGLADAVRAHPGELPSPLGLFGAALPGNIGMTGFAVEDVDVEFGAADDLFADPDGVVVEGGAAPTERRPVWLLTAALHLLLGAGALAFASRRVRTTGRGAGSRGVRRRAVDPDPRPAPAAAPASARAPADGPPP